MLTAVALAASTLISEDLASITAGLLVQRGSIGAITATVSVALGIFIGDLGLWALGRIVGVGLLEWPWAARRLRGGVMTSVRARLRQHLGWAIVVSRFTPGARLPLYVASGIFGVPFRPFATWSLLAVALWTPPVVLGSAAFGAAVSRVTAFGTGTAGLVQPAAAAVALWALLVVTRSRRAPWSSRRAVSRGHAA